MININFKQKNMRKMNVKKMMSMALFACGFFIFISCSKEMIEPAGDKPLASNEVQVVNGLLVFPDQMSLQQVLSGKEDSPLKKCASPFVSQQDVLEELAETELKCAELCNKAGKPYEHSGLYNDLLKEGLIREIFYSDGTQSYDLNLATPYYSEVLSKDGYFAVGDTIYQVTPTKLKIWEGGDINNYRLLAQYENTDEAKNIVVIDYSKKALPETRALFPIKNIDQAVGAWLTIEKRRFGLAFYDKLVSITPPNSYRRETYVQFVSQVLLEGRTWNLSDAQYYFFINITTLTDGVSSFWGREASGTSMNKWYAVWVRYEAMLEDGPNGTIQEEYDTYSYITKFSLVFRSPIDGMKLTLDGERAQPMNGPFYYSLFPQLDNRLSFMDSLIPRGN